LEDYQAFYHFAAANQAESDRLYSTTLTAPKEWLEMAILETRGFANSDLDDFLHLFPDHSQAQQVRAMLQGAIDVTRPLWFRTGEIYASG
jgi:hypothetical protein